MMLMPVGRWLMLVTHTRWPLPAAARSYKSVRVDGHTKADERQAVVDNFNNVGVGQVRAAGLIW